MTPAHLMLNVGLLVVSLSVAWAGVEFRPLPAGLSVQVTSSTPLLPTPTLQKWIVTKRTIALADDVVFSAYVTDCPACEATVHFCQSADPTQCSYYSSFAQRMSLNTVGGGWFNRSVTAPLFTAAWPRGVYSVSLSFISDNGAGLSNSYTPARLESVFGAGAGSITLTDYPVVNVNQPVASVDYFSVSPSTLSSNTEEFTISIRLTGMEVDYAYLFFTPTNVGYVGSFSRYVLPVDNWVNVTGPMTQYSSDYRRQANTPYLPYALLHVVGIDKFVRMLPSDFASVLGAANVPNITFTGAAFSTNHAAPHCNFTLTAGPLNVNAAPAQALLSAVCDNNAPWNSQWFLAAPVGSFFYGGEQGDRSVQNTITIAQGAAPGVYSVSSIWVADEDGNIAVYSNSRPPFLRSFWTSELLGEDFLYGDELNRLFGEATTSGVGGVSMSLFTVYAYACVAVAAAAWRLLE